MVEQYSELMKEIELFLLFLPIRADLQLGGELIQTPVELLWRWYDSGDATGYRCFGFENYFSTIWNCKLGFHNRNDQKWKSWIMAATTAFKDG